MAKYTFTELLALADRLQKAGADQKSSDFTPSMGDVRMALVVIRELAALMQAAGKGVTDKVVERALEIFAEIVARKPWSAYPDSEKVIGRRNMRALLEAVAPMLVAPGESSIKLGSWLSAALDDPNSCAEFKADIQAWFDAGSPSYTAQPEPSVPVSKLRELVKAMRARGSNLSASNLQFLIEASEEQA